MTRFTVRVERDGNIPQSEEPLILSLSKPGMSLYLPEWAEVLPSQGRGVVKLSKVWFLENYVRTDG
jgi:hypothetical protein